MNLVPQGIQRAKHFQAHSCIKNGNKSLLFAKKQWGGGLTFLYNVSSLTKDLVHNYVERISGNYLSFQVLLYKFGFP